MWHMLGLVEDLCVGERIIAESLAWDKWYCLPRWRKLVKCELWGCSRIWDSVSCCNRETATEIIYYRIFLSSLLIYCSLCFY